jgi:UDP:flavonoid glycosyltransferase YjiC (YdhE family)
VAALSLGVPVVVLPMGADQPDNGDRCQSLGVGLVLDVHDAGAPTIAAALQEVTRDPRYVRAAMELAGEAASQPRLEHLTEVAGLFLER